MVSNDSPSKVLASQSSFKVVPLDLQGQNQGQTTGNALTPKLTTGNALAPKLTVRLRQKWSQTIPQSKVLASQSSFEVVPLDLQGQIQGQTTGNALEPKLTVRLQPKVVSNDSPSKVLASQSSFKVVPLDLQGQIQGQTTGNALAPKLTVRLRRKWSQTIPRPKF